ncbi:MAG: sulfotransferase [Pseudomonadota bacterium]
MTASPIILYGALRSGTTVFRQMLGAHPNLHNPGEADYLFDTLHQGPDGWRYDLDALTINRVFVDHGIKLPESAEQMSGQALLADFLGQFAARGEGDLVLAIHRHIDKVAALLPEARVLHLLRDPRDVARSCIGMGWAAHPYFGVDGWLGTERAWDKAAPGLAGMRVLSLRYEDLIRETPERLSEVCSFLGHAFDPQMLRYHERTTYGPPDPGLIEQWRRKMPPDEAALVEGQVGNLLEDRGYAPGPTRARIPGQIEKLRLGIGNKLGVWLFAGRRYGFATVLSEKLSRRLGLRGWHRRTMERMNTRSRAFLK